MLRKYNSLFEIIPSLVKEWHPTANGKLTPRNLEVVYPKKVWWICSEGHEWQATIEHRRNQNDCPICEKGAAKKKIAPSFDLPAIGRNNRKSRRFKTKITAVIEVPESGHWVYADMRDFSSHGMSFELEAAIPPGTAIRIKFDKALVSSRLDQSLKSSFRGGYQTYNSTVRWCKPLDDDEAISSFGIGVQLS